MGACSYSNVWKNCATCNFWDGERIVAESKDSVTVDSSAVGQCNGFWQGRRKYGNDKCSEWALCDQLDPGAPETNPRRIYP